MEHPAHTDGVAVTCMCYMVTNANWFHICKRDLFQKLRLCPENSSLQNVYKWLDFFM